MISWRFRSHGDTFLNVASDFELSFPSGPNDKREYVSFSKYAIPNLDYLGYLRYSAAHAPLREHAHPGAFEICYLDRGTQTYRVHDEEYHLVGGDLFLTFPGELHSTGRRPEEKSVLYWIIFTASAGSDGFLGLGDEAAPLLAELKSIPRRLFKADRGVRHHLDELFRLDSEGGYLTRERIVHHVVEFLMTVVQSSRQSATDSIRDGLTDPILKAIDYINRNVHEAIPLQALARVAGLSVSHFKRRFRQETGVPPREFVLRSKVDAARRLLKANDMDVTETAFRLGFSSSQYFATVYKRFTGHSPSLDRG